MIIELKLGLFFLAFANCASIDKSSSTALLPAQLFQSRKIGTGISGGLPASKNQFPFYVYIIAKAAFESSACGGSILSTSWVLTAAHCTERYNSFDLYFGSTDVYAMPVILTSTQWIAHPNYNHKTYNNDLSLIELPPGLAYASSIQPVKLVPSSQAGNSFIGQSSLVMGFGGTSDSVKIESPDLLYASVQIISNIDCMDSYDSTIVTSGTICAQGISNQSICSGDTGGPMVIDNANGGYTQIGINSFVSNLGCSSGRPSGYVRVGSYLGWIASVTGMPLS